MEEIESYIVLIVSSILIRYSLIYSHQPWAKSYSQTITFLLLPIITYTITVTIAGNIALSLGMIGALSIVRFRHPVKNPLELVMYFNLITLGIAASVRTKWAILLVLVIVGSIFSIKLIQIIYKKFNRSFYINSFNEGIDLNIIEISAKDKVEILENNENLRNIIVQRDTNEIFYRLGFENKKELNKLKSSIETNNNINKIDITYV